MRRWLPEAESLMPALEVQFRVLKGNRGHVLQTRICSKPSRDPAPRFQYTIFSSISCAALRHGVFSVSQYSPQNSTFCINTENRPLCLRGCIWAGAVQAGMMARDKTSPAKGRGTARKGGGGVRSDDRVLS